MRWRLPPMSIRASAWAFRWPPICPTRSIKRRSVARSPRRGSTSGRRLGAMGSPTSLPMRSPAMAHPGDTDVAGAFALNLEVPLPPNPLNIPQPTLPALPVPIPIPINLPQLPQIIPPPTGAEQSAFIRSGAHLTLLGGNDLNVHTAYQGNYEALAHADTGGSVGVGPSIAGNAIAQRVLSRDRRCHHYRHPRRRRRPHRYQRNNWHDVYFHGDGRFRRAGSAPVSRQPWHSTTTTSTRSRG